MKVELGEKKFFVAIAASLALIAFVLVSSVYMPLGAKLRKASQELKAMEGELEMVRGTIKARESYGKRSLPTQEGISIAIDELTRRGRTLGINFISISPQKIEEVQGLPYRLLPICMELESRYEEFGRFLGALEELGESVVTIESFEIERDERVLPKVRTKLVAEMYLIK